MATCLPPGSTGEVAPTLTGLLTALEEISSGVLDCVGGRSCRGILLRGERLSSPIDLVERNRVLVRQEVCRTVEGCPGIKKQTRSTPSHMFAVFENIRFSTGLWQSVGIELMHRLFLYKVLAINQQRTFHKLSAASEDYAVCLHGFTKESVPNVEEGCTSWIRKASGLDPIGVSVCWNWKGMDLKKIRLSSTCRLQVHGVGSRVLVSLSWAV